MSKILLSLNIAHSIASAELNCCVSLDQYIKLVNDLSKKLSASPKISQKVQSLFNMIAFYSKVNRNAKIDFGFISVIVEKIQQIITKIEAKIDKLASE
jgi:hypothetical protein